MNTIISTLKLHFSQYFGVDAYKNRLKPLNCTLIFLFHELNRYMMSLSDRCKDNDFSGVELNLWNGK